MASYTVKDKSSNQSQLFLSIFDIHLETIRDFGKYFFNPISQQPTTSFNFQTITEETLEKENAELLDNSNEAI